MNLKSLEAFFSFFSSSFSPSPFAKSSIVSSFFFIPQTTYIPQAIQMPDGTIPIRARSTGANVAMATIIPMMRIPGTMKAEDAFRVPSAFFPSLQRTGFFPSRILYAFTRHRTYQKAPRIQKMTLSSSE